MMFARLRRKTQIRRRKGQRETTKVDATRFKDLVISKALERGEGVHAKFSRKLRNASGQRDGNQRLYKLDLRRCHLTDDHVEALTDALLELPVVRKLDLRGNKAITAQTLSALNRLLKVQVGLFRRVQADPSPERTVRDNSSLRFLHSVKLDASVLKCSTEEAKELEAYTAALEVADSVLDVRHAFFQADIRETGTLTQLELSGAMRNVTGETPKQDETARILRTFGEEGAEGKDHNLIGLRGFEAAMAKILRETHSLPLLPRVCDDLLFGPAVDTDKQNLRPASSPREKRSEGKHDLDNGTEERGHSPRDQISSKTGESAVSWRGLPTKVSPQRSSAERTRRNLGEGASGAGAHDKVRMEPRLTDTNTVTVKGKGKGEITEAGSASCGVGGRQGDRTTPDAQTGPSPRSLDEVGEEMSWASKTMAVIRGSLERTGDGHVLPNSANFERGQDKTCPSTAQGTVSSTIEQVVPSAEMPARQRFSTTVQQTVTKAPIVLENGSEIAGMSTTISTAGIPTVTGTFTRKAGESKKNAGHDQAADDRDSFQLATCKDRIVSTMAAVSPFADAPSSARDPILENILRTARSMASSCEERELVAVQVQQSAESDIRSTVTVTSPTSGCVRVLPPVQVQLDEGSLVMSCNGLKEMDIVLKLEATHGLGIDKITALHTLVLSNNQLQTLDFTALNAMPALRHLDVSNNVLRRMGPADGQDLPPRLETLIMSHNNIPRISGIGRCCALRAIDLSFNRIQRVAGLEHLSLLEQLDLGHNLIPTTAAARALSLNINLKLLRLEGNPVDENPRYRPALTCLLPHVRSIDSRRMPPSFHRERRGPVGVSRSGTVRAGSRGNGQGDIVSRESQEERDERRSREWHRIIAWREKQAVREQEKEWQTLGGGKAHQAVDAAHQRRQAEELAHAHPRTRASEGIISKARAVVSHRPDVVFGVNYGGERSDHISKTVVAGSIKQPTIASQESNSVSDASNGFMGTQLPADGKAPAEITTTTRTCSEEARIGAGATNAVVKIQAGKVEEANSPSASRAGSFDEWLRDVRLETETSETALQVLQKMYTGRRYRSSGGQRRVARFRAALEEMGLFCESYGPAPMVAGNEIARSQDVVAAIRRVAMTKAAMRGMLRLLEESESDESGGRGQEIVDRYAKSMQQQDEIVAAIGGSTHRNQDGRTLVSGSRDKRGSAKTFAARGDNTDTTMCAPSGSFAPLPTPDSSTPVTA